ncbi:MAG: hypothetical protein HY363_02240 [Candidatus Aenigmarchaeota archaeon]|nr:hypothetical protein [Candidatus Aenigmarchaeota archaeon]
MAKPVAAIKKKRWITVAAPQEFGGGVIGETYLAEAQEGVGRTLSVSLMTLTGDPGQQSVHIDFKIVSVQNNSLMTEVTGFNIISSAVRKMMRRGKEKVEDSFIVCTQDKKNVRVKPILVTKNRAKGGVLVDLQKRLRNTVLKMTAELNYTDFVNNLVSHHFQKQLQDSLKKLYPVSVCEIRWMSVEPTGVPIKETAIASRLSDEEEPPVAETSA